MAGTAGQMSDSRACAGEIAPARRRFRELLVLVWIISFIASGCGDGGSPSPKKRSEPSAKPAPEFGPTGGKVDLARVGSIRGMARFSGKAPARKKLDIRRDRWCAALHEVYSEDLVVSEKGGLRDALVWIEGLDGHAASFPVPEAPAQLRQRECRYLPHVLALRVDQTLEVINEDDTSHNYHFTGNRNAEVNRTQPIPATHEVSFSEAEIGATFRCDYHPWMSCRVHIFPHPGFGVTNADGDFEISGIPAGKYRIHFQHDHCQVEVASRVVTVAADGEIDLGEILFR